MTQEDNRELHEERQSLWLIALGPSVWAIHFLVSYASASVWCATNGRTAGLGLVRAGIAVGGVAAMAIIGWIGWTGWRMFRLEGGEPPFDRDTPQDRYRFLGGATALLAAMSAVATAFVCLSIAFVEDCL